MSKKQIINISMNRQEEIEFMDQLEKEFAGSNLYLESLFSANFVRTVIWMMQSDHLPDISKMLEDRDANIGKLGKIIQQLNYDLECEKNRTAELRVKITDNNSKWEEELLSTQARIALLDNMILQRDAQIAAQVEESNKLLARLIMQEDKTNERDLEIMRLKAEIYDLRNS